MQKGKLLSWGMTAEVYEWDEDKILKLFFDKFGEQWALNEAEIGRTIHQTGVPSPEVFERIVVEDRNGIVMERIFGKTMYENFLTEPWKVYYYAIKLAQLQYRVHQYTSKRLPSQEEKLTASITKSSQILGSRTDKILEYLHSLEDGFSVCHGDFHLGNIMVSRSGFIPIDWMNAYIGNPMGDVVRTYLITASPITPLTTPFTFLPIIHYTKKMIYLAYLNEYMRLSNAEFDSIDVWVLPMAADKIKDNIPNEKKWLMDIIDRRLARYNLT